MRTIPTYRYKCNKCGKEVRKNVSINKRDETFKCDECDDGIMERQFQTPRVLYYTDGFYSTEERGQKPKGF